MNKAGWKRLAGTFLCVCLLAGCGNEAAERTSSDSRDKGASNISETLKDGTGNEREQTASSDTPEVYLTGDISPEGIMRVYERLSWEPKGNTAVKLSTGEPPDSNYLRPGLIRDLLQHVEETIVECNTAYGGLVQRLPCIIRWQKTMVSQKLQIFRFWMRMAL